MKRLLITLACTLLFAAAHGQTANTLKAKIDDSITNRATTGAITPKNLGNRMKDIVNWVVNNYSTGGGGGGITYVAGRGIVIADDTVKIDTVFTDARYLRIKDTANMLAAYFRITDTGLIVAGYMRLGDTANMLLPYLRKGDTAAMLIPYLRKTDTTAMLAPYMRKIDTAAMLLPYLRKLDTAGMLLPYLRKFDTTAMLLPYLRDLDTIAMLLPYLRKGDTAGMLSPYLRKVDTTAMLLPYLRDLDTIAMLLPYLRKGDTAGMLSPYLRKVDTTAMLLPYLRTIDTTAMLSTYLRSFDTTAMLLPYLRKIDTTAMLNPYLRKQDTAAMLTSYIRKIDKLGAVSERFIADSSHIVAGDTTGKHMFSFDFYSGTPWGGINFHTDSSNTINMLPSPGAGITPDGKVMGQWVVYANTVTGLNTIGSLSWSKVGGTNSRFSILSGTTANNSLFTWGRDGLNTLGVTVGANPVSEKDSIRHASYKSSPAVASPWAHFYGKKAIGGTGDFLQYIRSAGDTIARMDVNGNLYATAFLPPDAHHVSADYTVNDTDSYIIVDAACTLTFPATLRNKEVKVQKGSTSDFYYTIHSTLGINGNGDITVSDSRVVTMFYDGSTYWADYTIAPHDNDHDHVSDHLAKSDGVVLPLHAKAGTDTITCTGCVFPSTVVGMGMFIDSARANASFSSRHMAVVAKVTTRVNDTTVRIDKTASYTVRNTPGIYGTINFPYFLAANNYARTTKLNKVEVNGQGIYCLFPQLSDSAALKCIPLRQSVTWESEPAASIFLGVEDQNFVDQDSMYNFNLFEIQASGNYVLRGIKAWGRNYSDQNVGGPTFVTQKQSVKINGSLGVYDCEAYGDTSVKSYNKDLYWGFGINLSARVDSGNSFILDAKNNKFYCNTEFFQAFDDHLGKECYFDGLVTKGGGSPRTLRKWGNHASIASGSHILTVDVDSFSFLHQNSQYDSTNRQYPVSINYGAGTFNSHVDSIIDPHTAYLADAAPVDIVDKEPVFYGPEGEDKYSNQAVFTSWKNVLSQTPSKYNYHKYGTGSAPDAKPSVYINCVTDTTGMLFGGTSFQGDLLSRHDETITVENCKFYFTPYNQPINIRATNSWFPGDEFVNRGISSYFKDCVFDGQFFQFAADTVTMDNCRAKTVQTGLGCYLKVNNSVVKYVNNDSRTDFVNTVDSNGHLYNNKLRLGSDTDLVRVMTADKHEERSIPKRSFTTPAVVHDSLSLYLKKSDSTGLYGFTPQYQIDTMRTRINAALGTGGLSYIPKDEEDSTGLYGYVTHYQDDSAKNNIRTSIAGKLNISDTASLLATYLRKVDTTGKWVHISDSGYMLAPYLRKVDTTAMLNPYLRKIDTTGKWVHISDSGYMLAPYLRKVDTTAMLNPYLRKIDTTAMLAPYLRKVDTTAMLNPYLRKIDTTGKWIHWTDTPSVIYTKYDVDTAKTNIRASIGGGGGGGGNINQVFIQTADKTVDNTGTETTLIGTGTGSTTLATGDINTAAKSVWFRMEGIFSTTASGDDVVFRVKYGTTTLGSVTVTGTNLGTSQTDLGWSIEGVITTRTTGATGTVMCTAKVTWDATKAVTGSGSNFIFGTATLGGGTATTVDLTSSKAFDITCDWTNAASGRKFTAKNFILEKM